jgi:hypothetical protein
MKPPVAKPPVVKRRARPLNWAEGARRLAWVGASLYWLAAVIFAVMAFYSHRLDLGPLYTIRSPEGFTYVVHARSKTDAMAAAKVYAQRVQQEYASYAAVDMEPIEVPAATPPRLDILQGLGAAIPVLLGWGIGFVGICAAVWAGLWVVHGFIVRAQQDAAAEVEPRGMPPLEPTNVRRYPFGSVRAE